MQVRNLLTRCQQCVLPESILDLASGRVANVLQGVTCGQLATIVLHTVDCFSNARVSGGEHVRGRRCTQADVTDNCDGTYALQFRLPLAGHWQLSASVNGKEVPWPQAASLKSEHAALTAAECEISGVDGIVSCGTSDPIFIQVRACMLPAAVLYCPVSRS